MTLESLFFLLLLAPLALWVGIGLLIWLATVWRSRR